MKTGILGGTFDPVHNGHILIASETIKRLGLDEVLFMPAARSPFKLDISAASVEHRVRMVELAIADYRGFRLSTIEIDRAGPSYTVDTLEILNERSGELNELFFIIGLDSLLTLPDWKKPERIVRLCRIVTVCRPGYEIPRLAELEEKLPGLQESLILLEEPLVDISSTDIRQRIRQGSSVSDMLPPKVEDYIRENTLYREGK
ncbi:MAG: nicotinate-nucleotide adenylyltransferase [Dehalococcoidales bacterium]|nr:nicotinate-nucleotide adenylyltransferase [Dehalococcoidales bacterium]